MLKLDQSGVDPEFSLNMNPVYRKTQYPMYMPNQYPVNTTYESARCETKVLVLNYVK